MEWQEPRKVKEDSNRYKLHQTLFWSVEPHVETLLALCRVWSQPVLRAVMKTAEINQLQTAS